MLKFEKHRDVLFVLFTQSLIMTKSGLPKSVRKFIRLEKARIRAQFFDAKKQEDLISELYKKFSYNPVALDNNKNEPKTDTSSKIKEAMPTDKQEKIKAQTKSSKLKKVSSK